MEVACFYHFAATLCNIIIGSKNANNSIKLHCCVFLKILVGMYAFKALSRRHVFGRLIKIGYVSL